MIDLDKFFEKLSPSKVFIVNIVTTAFFWYLSIFLFKKELITEEQIQISIIVSFCLSFCWSAINFMLIASLSDIAAKGPITANRRMTAFLMNIFFSVLTLGIAMIIEMHKMATFRSFVGHSFLGLSFAAIPFVIGAIRNDSKRKVAMKKEKEKRITSEAAKEVEKHKEKTPSP